MSEENKGDILLYQTEDSESKIEVRLSNDTVWLTLDKMAQLFQRNKSTISRHIKNVFESGELKTVSTVAFFSTVQKEGVREVEREISYYNLDKERTKFQLSPVEIHFIENFEKERKKLKK